MNKFYPLFFKLLVIVCVFYTGNISAQVNVNDNQTATALAQKLVGGGVLILNPTLTCNTKANGIFSVVSSNLGLDSGIILSTGYAKTQNGIVGSNGPANGFANPNASYSFGSPGDAQLSALSGVNTNDACVLQFDFRPAGDTIKFQYVFGSEEYTSYTCSGFNDVFGFFISGPGIAGAPDIALVPGTNIPVAVNSVNCGATGGNNVATCNAMGPGSPFCTYYVNNYTGTTISYDGLTTVLTAISTVTPCDTYHLKLGVADGGDDAYDSGVWIKAGSLVSTGIHLAAQGIADTFLANTAHAVRGCTPGEFIFCAPAPLTDTEILHFILAGTAVNGVDYTQIADSLIMYPGTTCDTIFIQGLIVNPPTGPETVILKLLSPYTCNGQAVVVDSAVVTIFDPVTVVVTTTPDTTICIGQNVHIQTTGTPGIQYSWAPSGTLDNPSIADPTATPTTATTYTVSATLPNSGCPAVDTSFTINIATPVTLSLPPELITCLNVPVTLPLSVTPSGTYTFSWTPADYLNDATAQSPVATPPSDQTFIVTANPSVPFCTSVDSIHIRVLPNDFNLYSPDSTVCRGAIIQIRADGDSEFTYMWTPPQGVSNTGIVDPIIIPDSTRTYTITATYPNCPDMVHQITLEVQKSVVHILTPDTSFCITGPVQLRANSDSSTNVTYLWSPAENLDDPTALQPYFYNPAAAIYNYTLIVTTPIGCKDSGSVMLTVRPSVVLDVTPKEAIIKYGDHIQLDAFNTKPELLYYFWTPDNGTLDNPNINYPLATPTENTSYLVVGMNEYGCIDSQRVNITIDYTMNEFIPSAFSPNGDGRNDVFRILNMKYQKLLDFRVYNRWGQQIFQTDNVEKGWDGNFNGVPQEMGTYNYVIIVARPDGTEKSYSGTVTLVR